MVYRVLAFLLAVAIVPAFAQDRDHDADEKDMENFRLLIEKEAEALSVNNPQDSDIINLVERIMMVRLAKTLNLTVEETQNLGTRVAHCRGQVYNLKWLRADLRQSLRESIESGDDVTVEQRLEKLLKLDITIAQLIEKMIEDSQSDLTAEQAAKFYLFIEDFEQDLSRMIDRAQQLTHSKTVDSDEPQHNPGADSAAQ